MKISGYLIHEDEDYAVLGSLLFKLSSGRFGTLKVFCKHIQTATAATSSETRYLNNVLGLLAQAGQPFRKADLTSDLFHEFAAAVCTRGGWAYDAFFQESAEERARNALQ